MASSGTELPHHLAEGTLCRHWMPLAGVKMSLREQGFSNRVRVRGFYNDALGKDHLSDDVEIDFSRD